MGSAAHVERQREQDERHQVERTPGSRKSIPAKHLAPAASKSSAQLRCCAMQRGRRSCARNAHTLVAQGRIPQLVTTSASQVQTGTPVRARSEAYGQVQIEHGECQYNREHDGKRIGDSLADAAILVLTQLPDRALRAGAWRMLVEQRLAACVSVGAPADSPITGAAQPKLRGGAASRSRRARRRATPRRGGDPGPPSVRTS